jgi:hypothetical protein
MTSTFENKNSKAYESGHALAKRILGVSDEFLETSGIKEVADPLNASFTEGYRFSLVAPNKYRVYFSEDADAYRGACDYAEKGLGVPCDTLVTDVIDFNKVEGGEQVTLTGKTERKSIVHIQSNDGEGKHYQLTYDPKTTVVSLFLKEDQYISLVSDTLTSILTDRDFLDNETENMPDIRRYFFTQAMLTTMAGLPAEFTLMEGDTSVSFKDSLGKVRVIKSEALLSVFSADYLSSIV